jgi:hypothetical protein
MIKKLLLLLVTLLFFLPVVNASGYSVSYPSDVSELVEIELGENYSFVITLTNLSSDSLSLEVDNQLDNIDYLINPIELEGYEKREVVVTIIPKTEGHFERDLIITLETLSMKAGKVRISFNIQVVGEKETNWLLIVIGSIVALVLLLFGIKVKSVWQKRRN